MFFDTLYDEDVIKEEAFYKWESSKDPAEQTGKGVALKSVTAFFTWLREAEEESDKEWIGLDAGLKTVPAPLLASHWLCTSAAEEQGQYGLQGKTLNQSSVRIKFIFIFEGWTQTTIISLYSLLLPHH